MAKLTPAARAALPKSDFAVPSKAPGPGSYPMPDPQHAAVAQGLAAMHGGPVAKVQAKAESKFGGGSSNPDNKLPQHAMHPRGRNRGMGPGSGGMPGDM